MRCGPGASAAGRPKPVRPLTRPSGCKENYMKNSIPLRYRRVLWGAVMTAFSLCGLTLIISNSPRRAHKARPGRLPAAAASAAQPRLAERYGRLPLSFEINWGQTDKRVKFLSRGKGYSLFLTHDEAVFKLNNHVAGRRG